MLVEFIHFSISVSFSKKKTKKKQNSSILNVSKITDSNMKCIKIVKI